MVLACSLTRVYGATHGLRHKLRLSLAVLYSPILFVSANPVPVQPSLPKPRFFIVLTLLFGLLWFGQLDYRKLVKPDEGRYAEISREMAASGDWVTPRLNGLKYFEKPPMQYWATAAAFRVFGVNEWTARLWTALTGFAGVQSIEIGRAHV